MATETIEGEMQMVGFTDAAGKKTEYYWRNEEFQIAWENISFRSVFIGFTFFGVFIGVMTTLGTHLNVFFWSFEIATSG